MLERFVEGVGDLLVEDVPQGVDAVHHDEVGDEATPEVEAIDGGFAESGADEGPKDAHCLFFTA